MVKPKCSIYFPYIFSKFSSNFLQLFQMTKLNCFHHHRSTDVCKNTGIGKTFYSKECFLCKNSSTGCTTSASTAPAPAVATSHMTSRVCVCVRVSGWISQPYIVLCPVSKHKLAEMPQQDRFLWMTPLNSCKNNGWDGETELSSHAPARPQTARLKHVRHIETPRSAKHEANNRLYKIWPLWQQKAIAIWPSASEHGYSIHEAKRHSLDFTLRRALWSTAFQRSLFILLVPTAILQREGFWQHKGLGKNINTYYDFGCECHPDLQRLGNTKRARLLLEVDVDSGGWNCQFLFPFNGLTAETIPYGSGGNTFNGHHAAFFTTNTSDEDVVRSHSHTPTNHELIAHVADKETLLINCHCTLKGKTEKSWGQHLLQVVLSTGEDPQKAVEAHQAMKLQETHARGTMFVGAESIWKAFPANSKPRMSSCVSEPCKLNPCPSVCYLHVLTKAQGKGTWALPKKNLAKALEEYLAKEGCLEHPFSKQILRNYQPCVSTPNNSWTIQRKC